MNSSDSGCPALDAIIRNRQAANEIGSEASRPDAEAVIRSDQTDKDSSEKQQKSSESSGPGSDATTINRGETTVTQTESSQPSRLASDAIIGNYRDAAGETEAALRQMRERMDEPEIEPTEEGANGVVMEIDEFNVQTYYEDDLRFGNDYDVDYSDEEEHEADMVHSDDDDVMSLFHYGSRRLRYGYRHGGKRDGYLSDGMSDDEDNLPICSEKKETTTEEDICNGIIDEYLHNCSACSF